MELDVYQYEGIVFRRKEGVLRRWSEWFLILKGSSFLFFTKKGEASPKRTMLLTADCEVSPFVVEHKAQIGTGGTFYTFSLLYPEERLVHYDPFLQVRDGLFDIASMFKLWGDSELTPEGKRQYEFGCRDKIQAEEWASHISQTIQHIRLSDKSRRERRHQRHEKSQIACGSAPIPPPIQRILDSHHPITPIAQNNSYNGLIANPSSSGFSSRPSSELDVRGEVGQACYTGESQWSVEGGKWVLYRVADGCPVWRLVEGESSGIKMDEEQAKLINQTVSRTLGLGLLMLVILAIKGYGWGALIGGILTTAGILNGMARNARLNSWTYYTGDVVRGSPAQITQHMLNIEMLPMLIPAVAYAEVLETINEYTDIIYLCQKPIFVLFFYAQPRDLVLLRYWRKEEDGSRMIIYQSTTHLKRPPRTGFTRAFISSAAMAILPEYQEISLSRNSLLERSMVNVFIDYNPMGIGKLVTVVMRRLQFITPWLLQ
eukprot:Ihof_evm1s419 gene=Ihof_evmTU1s419